MRVLRQCKGVMVGGGWWLVTPRSVQLPQPPRDLAGAGPARVPGGRRLQRGQRGLLPPVHRQLQSGAVY